MKKQILIAALIFKSIIGLTQDTGNDPYKIFGHKSSTKYETTISELLYIKNSDTTSPTKAVAFDVKNSIVIYLGINNRVLKIDSINSEKLLRFISTDPMAKDRVEWTPYNFCRNNPINNVDPTGGLDAPIYDQSGTFLGTDDQGLQGKGIVLDKSNFQQGMKHEDALKNNLGFAGLKDNKAISNFVTSYNSLSSRPDYDGFVTIQEGIDWAKSHEGALSNPTAENMLYIDASKLNFGNLTTSDFTNGIGKSSPIQLNTLGNFLESSSNPTLRATVYALGRVYMTLLDNNGSVNIINGNEATDYNWNRGGGFPRSQLIDYERWRANLTDADGFKTYYYGIGKLNSPPSISENYAKYGPYY